MIKYEATFYSRHTGTKHQLYERESPQTAQHAWENNSLCFIEATLDQ